MINLPERDYYQYVVKPFLEMQSASADRLHLPMIDLSYSTQDALPPYLWGLLWKGWEPTPCEGNTVFLEDYSARGEGNHKKKIYYSGVTPDLYRDKFGRKVHNFFEHLLSDKHVGTPLMRQYLDNYFDLYWDLHLGASGDDIPFFARDIGQSFNTVLALLNPFDDEFRTNYSTVRELRERLDLWISERLDAIEESLDQPEGGFAGADKTFAYYWLKNTLKSQNHPEDYTPRREDVAFECFHNFVALSQWGNTLYNIMDKLRVDGGDDRARDYLAKMIESDSFNEKDGSRFTRIDRFVMELFRTIMPNDGSISTLATPTRLRSDQVYTKHDHVAISNDPIHWSNPETFDPNRYLEKPASDEIDSEQCTALGFAKCPFSEGRVDTADDRGTVTNSGFGTVYNQEKGGTAHPVLDYAGYGPFGFGYRRCPGELLTVEVIKEFLRRVVEQGIEFRKLEGEAQRVPVGPGTVVEDNIGFTKK